MIISERILNILSEKGMSQKQFSDCTGISQSTISDWKTKKTNPAADKIMVICDVLGITTDELLSGTKSRDGKRPEYIVLNKESEEYMFLEEVKKMDALEKKHLLEYMRILKEKEQKCASHTLVL